MLQFSPSHKGSSITGAESQNRPAVHYGVSAAYALARQVAANTVPGLLSAAPSLSFESQRTNTVSHVTQPAVGVSYRF